MQSDEPKFYDLLQDGIKALYDGNYEEAQKLLEKAINLDPLSVNCWYNLAKVYSNLEQFEKAIQSYKKIVELEETPTNLYNLACEFYNNDDFQEAIRYYHLTIDLDPDFVQAFDGLGSSYGCSEEYDKAIENYRKAIDLEPANASYYNNLGWFIFHF